MNPFPYFLLVLNCFLLYGFVVVWLSRENRSTKIAGFAFGFIGLLNIYFILKQLGIV